jgi:DNA integrity scanning protein DisA with diadenylate cyclase activity
LTAIDGATVLTQDCSVLAFGAKIIRPDGVMPAEQVALVEPVEGSESRIVPVGQLGGTRHLSAVQFANAQRDAIAMVASQDGPFTIFSWSECDKMVYGYRVESLLL